MEWWRRDGQMIFGDLGGLKFPGICLTGEEKPHPGNLSRSGIEPGPAAWHARMLSLAPQRWTKNYCNIVYPGSLKWVCCLYLYVAVHFVFIPYLLCTSRRTILIRILHVISLRNAPWHWFRQRIVEKIWVPGWLYDSDVLSVRRNSKYIQSICSCKTLKCSGRRWFGI